MIKVQKFMKEYAAGCVAMLLGFGFIIGLVAGCSQADVASHNLSRAADNFEIARKIVFYNGITDKIILEVEGFCSVYDDTTSNQLEVTCKLEQEKYVKHFLGLSDNVTYFAEQLEAVDVSTFHYRVRLQPQSIIPDFDIGGSGEQLLENTVNPPPSDDGSD